MLQKYPVDASTRLVVFFLICRFIFPLLHTVMCLAPVCFALRSSTFSQLPPSAGEMSSNEKKELLSVTANDFHAIGPKQLATGFCRQEGRGHLSSRC